jgi:PAS domain-containing protein
LNANFRLPLHHNWPIFEQGRRFVLGQLLDEFSLRLPECAGKDLVRLGIGHWQCELPQEKLTWADAVYDIFGLPRQSALTRAEAVTFYGEHSRAVLERIRAVAIEQGRGFVLDAEIMPGHGERRWMRIVASPVFDGEGMVRLEGLKRLL